MPETTDSILREGEGSTLAMGSCIVSRGDRPTDMDKSLFLTHDIVTQFGEVVGPDSSLSSWQPVA